MARLLAVGAALAAIGAGIVHLGIAAISTPALLAVLAVVGAAEVAWGVWALRAAVLPRPRTALAVALLLAAGWAATLVAHPHMAAMGRALLPFGASAGATVLDVALAALLAAGLRLRRPAGRERPVRFVLGAGLAAALVAVVVAKSLSTTAIGHGMTMH